MVSWNGYLYMHVHMQYKKVGVAIELRLHHTVDRGCAAASTKFSISYPAWNQRSCKIGTEY
jgi:hypothetical protein